MLHAREHRGITPASEALTVTRSAERRGEASTASHPATLADAQRAR
jgi:hypothetical protein